MTTACIACTPSTSISLYRPAWRRWLDQGSVALRATWERRRRARRLALQRCLAAFRCWDSRRVAELDDHLLRDIGVPDWLREAAAARRHPGAADAAFEGPLGVRFDGGTRGHGASSAADDLRGLGARW